MARLRTDEDLDELLRLASGGAHGQRRALARLLSIVEHGGREAQGLSESTARAGGGTYSVGLTGAPGSGKSTLASALVGEAKLRGRGPIAVLAVDPSSPLSGGAILGDRVRMQDHALEDDVFIRSMASRGHLGGLAASVPDAIRLFGATGWPLVLVETVGVGQVEVEVAAACDSVVVVVNPGWGDAVQANKAGLLEVADILVINKADRPGVRETRRDLAHMLQMSTSLGFVPPIVESVATTGDGVTDLVTAIDAHRAHLESTGELEARRIGRLKAEAERIAVGIFAAEMAEEVRSSTGATSEATLRALAERRMSPGEAARQLAGRVAEEVSRRLAGA